MMLHRTLACTRSARTWWIDIGPSGSAVEMEEKTHRVSKEDVDGKCLLILAAHPLIPGCASSVQDKQPRIEGR